MGFIFMNPRIAVRRLPVVFWSTFYVDLTSHGLRQSDPSNPVDPIQPQKGLGLRLNQYNRETFSVIDHHPPRAPPIVILRVPSP